MRGDLLRSAASVFITGVLAASPVAAVAQGTAAGPEGRLLEATVSLRRFADSVTVDAEYRFDPGTGVLGLTAMRLRRQTLTILSTSRSDGSLPGGLTTMARPGLWRLEMDRSSLQGGTLRLRYRVYGRPGRVPLFVPTLPTDPVHSRVTILVRGYPAGIQPGETFPRLESGPDAELVTHTTELPGVVHIGRAVGGLTIGAAANVAVLLLILAGAGTWLFVRLRLVRRSRRLSDPIEARAASDPSRSRSA